MKLKKAISLIECSKKYQFEEMNLYKDNRYHVLRTALAIFSNLVQYFDWFHIDKEIRSYLHSNYQKQDFDFQWQKERTIIEDLQKFERLNEWFNNNGDKKVSGRKIIKLPFRGAVGGIELESLDVTIDFITKRQDGSLHAYILCPKFKRPYSKWAKSEKNKITNCPELLSALECMTMEYPNKEITVSLVQLISKRDTPTKLARFEEQDGDNIITLSKAMLRLRDRNQDSLFNDLVEVLQEKECDLCYFQELCLFQKPKEPNVGQLRISPVQTRVYELPKFTDKQLFAIRETKKNMRIVAGAGTGKTAVLVARVAHLIDAGVPAEAILVVTYSKKAAQELEDRVVCDKKPKITTLHGLGYQLICKYSYLLGRRVVLADKIACMQLLLEVLEYAPVLEDANYQGLKKPYGLLNQLLNDFEYLDKHGIAQFQKRFPNKEGNRILVIKDLYQQKYEALGYISYQEQIDLAIHLLQNYPYVQNNILYRYILLDEAQDCDSSQCILIQLLSQKRYLTVCGDGDQAIFGFRGGTNKLLLNFIDDYPDAIDVRLDMNFRSSKEIVTAANELIGQDFNRIPVNLISSFENNINVQLITNFMGNQIVSAINYVISKGYKQGDIAIIARTNKELNGLCDFLDITNSNIENKLLYERPKTFLYLDYTFQVILDLLILYTTKLEDNFSMYRILQHLRQSENLVIDIKNIKRSIYYDLVKNGVIIPQNDNGDYQLDTDIKKAFSKIYHTMNFFERPIKEAISQIASFFIGNEEIYGETLKTLYEKIDEKRINTAYELRSYMELMKIAEDETKISSVDKERLHFITAHSAKGKEYKAVIIYAADNFERGDEDEDRRLLYVAITRAKEMLLVTEVVPGKSRFGQLKSVVKMDNRRRNE